MDEKISGYKCKTYSMPVKRYCQTMDLKNDPELIAKYKEAHDRLHAWPEILAGIREVGLSSVQADGAPLSGTVLPREISGWLPRRWPAG